ncbi:glycosyltransferase [Rubritalea spongiae]|uniref:Glycosyltransferase n=1 Tax=Rubritalea spongiae TaxID=430797 RepID=A0ABW5E1B0_9BACT
MWVVFRHPRFLNQVKQTTGQKPKISIIIPARNEEHNIGILLSSISAQHLSPVETIVVDDGSTDGTAAVSRAAGARVTQAPPLPKNWKGKPWACQHGAQQAQGTWLLFLDADTSLEPDTLNYLSGLTNIENSAFSVCPNHRIQELYEELSSFFNLLMVIGVNAFSRFSRSHQTSALFGQCLFIQSNHYQQIHGHESVKNQTLENFHLAQTLLKHNIQCQSFLGGELISMRMFPNGITELWNSWKKGFSSGASKTNPTTLTISSIWITGAMLCIVNLCLTPFIDSITYVSLSTFCYLFYVVQCFWAFRLIGSYRYLNALFFPITLIFYQCLFFVSLMTKKHNSTTVWKGREVS